MRTLLLSIVLCAGTTGLALTGCVAPNKVVVHGQAGGVVEVQDGTSGATRIKISRENDAGKPKPTPQAHNDGHSQTAQVAANTERLSHLRAAISQVERDLHAVEGARDRVITEREDARRSVDALDKQLHDLRASHQEVETESIATVNQRAADIERLTAERETLFASIAQHHEEFTEIDKGIAARRSELDNLTAQMTAAVASTEAAHDELACLNQDISSLLTRRDAYLAEVQILQAAETHLRRAQELNSARRSDLAPLSNVVAIAPVTIRQTDLTEDPRQDVKSGAVRAAPSAGTASTYAAWIAAVSVVGLGVFALVVSMRKPTKFTFSLLDEDTKASHRMQLAPGDHLELGQAQLVRKASNRKPLSPFLSIDRRGRLSLNALDGFGTKLNGAPLNTQARQILKPGAVVEVVAADITKRLLVGPVAPVSRSAKATSIAPHTATVS